MKIKKPLFIVISNSILLLGLANCAPNKNKSLQFQPIQKKIYVSQGNPMELIAGAQKDPILRIDENEIDSYGEYVIKSVSSFQEKDLEDNESTIKDAEKDQAPTTETISPLQILYSQYIFKFFKIDDENIVFRGSADLDNLDLSMFDEETKSIIKSSKIRKISLEILFKKVPNGFQATKEISRENDKITRENEELNLLHISVANDKSAISFLSTENDKDLGMQLVDVQFAKKTSSFAEIGNKNFNYLEGPGKKVRWDTNADKEISICGGQSKFLTYPISEALKSWQSELSSPLNFHITFKEKYKPFSDLNQNCILYVKNYRLRTSKNVMSPAATIGARNVYEGKIISSNIFFFEEEYFVEIKDPSQTYVNLSDIFASVVKPGFEKTYKKHDGFKTDREQIGSYLYRSYFLDVALHEVGHFLGLDHIFDGTPSIMSYQKSNGTLEKYDKAAIKELYE